MPRRRLTSHGLFSRTAAPDESSGYNPNTPIALYDTHPNARFPIGCEVTFIDDKWLKIRGVVLGHVAEDRLWVQLPNSIAQLDVEDVVAFHEVREGIGQPLNDPVVASRGSRRRSALITFDDLDRALERRESGDDELEYIPDTPDFLDGDPVSDEHPGELPSEQDPRDKIEEVSDQEGCGCESLEVVMLLPEVDDLTDLIENQLTAARTAAFGWGGQNQPIRLQDLGMQLIPGRSPGREQANSPLTQGERGLESQIKQKGYYYLGKEQNGRIWFEDQTGKEYYLQPEDPGYGQQQAPGQVSPLSTFGIKEWWNRKHVTNSQVLNTLLGLKDNDGNPLYEDEADAAANYNLFDDPGIRGTLQQYGMNEKDIQMFADLREKQLDEAHKTGQTREWWQGTGVKLKTASRREAFGKQKQPQQPPVLKALLAMKDKESGGKLFKNEGDAALRYNLFDDPGVVRILEEYGLSDDEIHDYSDLRQSQLDHAWNMAGGQTETKKWGEATGVDFLRGRNKVKLEKPKTQKKTPGSGESGRYSPTSGETQTWMPEYDPNYDPNKQPVPYSAASDLELVRGEAPGKLSKNVDQSERERALEKGLAVQGKDAEGRVWCLDRAGVEYYRLPPGKKRFEVAPTPETPDWQRPGEEGLEQSTSESEAEKAQGLKNVQERGLNDALLLNEPSQPVMQPQQQKRNRWTPEDEDFLQRTQKAAARKIAQLRRRATFVNEFLRMPRIADAIRQAADVVEAVHAIDTGGDLDETTRSAIRNASRSLLEATDHLYRMDNRVAKMVAPQIEQAFAESLSN